jgi:hypothetical protein
LGRAVFNAVAVAAGHTRAKTLAEAIGKPFMLGTTQVWCQRHPGRNSLDRARHGWDKMARAYRSRSRPIKHSWP